MQNLLQLNTILSTVVGIFTSLGLLATQAKKIRNYLFGDLIKRLDNLEGDIKQTRLSTLRTELQTAIYNTPERVKVIEELYGQYKLLGGNFYIDEIMAVWREEYEHDILVKRIGVAAESRR